MCKYMAVKPAKENTLGQVYPYAHVRRLLAALSFCPLLISTKAIGFSQPVIPLSAHVLLFHHHTDIRRLIPAAFNQIKNRLH